MSNLDDYHIVPLRLTPKSVHCHKIFMRENKIRQEDPTKPKGRTLLMLNIPPYVTEDSLERFFSQIAEVQEIMFAEKVGPGETEKWKAHCSPFSDREIPFVFKIGYIVFKATSSIAKALEISSIDLFDKGSDESYQESGYFMWQKQAQNRMLNEEKTMERINEYMAEYDKREEAEQAAAKTSQADADGWITVGKQGHNAGFERKESVIERLEDKIEKGKKKKELKNFYTFQIRESNMQNVIDLRKKFEEDKEKIELIKKSRKFKPF